MEEVDRIIIHSLRSIGWYAYFGACLFSLALGIYVCKIYLSADGHHKGIAPAVLWRLDFNRSLPATNVKDVLVCSSIEFFERLDGMKKNGKQGRLENK